LDECNKDGDKGKRMVEASKEEMPGKKGQIAITLRHTTLGGTPLDE
jgi:hypothetical protein